MGSSVFIISGRVAEYTLDECKARSSYSERSSAKSLAGTTGARFLADDRSE
jgi:hypothetical protein